MSYDLYDGPDSRGNRVDRGKILAAKKFSTINPMVKKIDIKTLYDLIGADRTTPIRSR